MRRFVIFAAILSILAPVVSHAQSQYRTIATVDNSAITAYEVEQRFRFLRAIRAPGASSQLALEQLIEDRLKLAEANRAGLGLTPEGLDNALNDFAGRANLTLDEFTRSLGAQGVEPGTIREFVRAGVTWRELIRGRFNARAQISDAEIDRALGQSASSSSIRVLLNEIILPARPIRGEAAQARRNAERIQNITSISAFQREAGRLSVSQTRTRNGRLDWVPLSNLPGALRPIILGLKPGEVSEPIELENAILLFQLRAIEEVDTEAAAPAAIDYAALYLNGGRSEATLRQAEKIKDRVDTCDDLYGEAQRMPREALERGAKNPSEIPQDVAIELAKLDAGEVSTTLTRANGETLVFLMLCSRVPTLAEDTDREAIRNRLRSQRLAGFADGLLAELRAEAVIVVQ